MTFEEMAYTKGTEVAIELLANRLLDLNGQDDLDKTIGLPRVNILDEIDWRSELDPIKLYGSIESLEDHMFSEYKRGFLDTALRYQYHVVEK